MNHHGLFAEVTVKTLKGPGVTDLWKSDASSIRQVTVILGAIVVVVLAVFIWAAFIRKPRRPASERGVLLTEDEQKSRRHSRSSLGGKRRKRRRSRSRNPTLAQTGGLPPLRPEDPPDFAS